MTGNRENLVNLTTCDNATIKYLTLLCKMGTKEMFVIDLFFMLFFMKLDLEYQALKMSKSKLARVQSGFYLDL